MTGKISDSASRPVAFASISILTMKGQEIESFSADQIGAFADEICYEGEVIILVTSIGHENYRDTLSMSLGPKININVTLKTLIKIDEPIVVQGRKLPLLVSSDKITLNVANSIVATGSSAYDLLLRLPGVKIVGNEIMIEGKNGLSIYQDGKVLFLTGSDLISYLKSIPSSAISTMELLNNPPSKYDASGNAGVVEIKSNMNESFGLQGNLSLTSAYSSFNPKYSGSFNLFFNSKKINFLFNYNGFTGKFRSKNIYDREQTSSNHNVTRYNQEYYNTTKTNTNNFRFSISYNLFPRTKVGFETNYNKTNNSIYISSISFINEVHKDSNYILHSTNFTPQKIMRLNNDLYLSRKFQNGDLSINLSHGLFKTPSNSLQQNHFYDSIKTLGKTGYLNNTNTRIEISALNVGYTFHLTKSQFEVGTKISSVKTSNSLDIRSLEGISGADFNQKSQFTYVEKIHSGYLTYKWKSDYLNLQSGVRVENSSTSSILLGSSSWDLKNVKTNNLNIFPSGSLSFLRGINSYTLLYNFRIDRPNYRSLNPFLFILDDLTYLKGNPFLKPQTTHTIRFVYLYKRKLTASISYSGIRNFILSYRDTIDGTKTMETKVNLDRKSIYNFSINYTSAIEDWWNINYNVSAFKDKMQGTISKGVVLNLSQVSWSTSINNSLAFPQGLKVEIYGFYNSKYIDAPAIIRGQWSCDLGIQKDILKKRGSLKVVTTDVFNTWKYHLARKFSGLSYTNIGTWESRQVRFTFLYTIGNKSVKFKEDQQSSTDDEKRRTR